ncbi:phosphoesterase [Nocardia seriolae]|uniref:phospholipase C n=1 Tax=Nocardia seriolae TaxID=37332 RepID=A0ABC9YZJ0_9NOCA|nr:phosphoesterase [Nocardia seriolae]GAP30398.1 phosphoesterase [Nocardia seriolae]
MLRIANRGRDSNFVRASHRRTASRRTVLAGAGALALSTAVGATGCRESTDPVPAALPAPGDSGIDHIIVLMMENRSFDHQLGWMSGANGKQAGLSFTDRNGKARKTFRLSTTQGCSFADPDHSFEGGRVALNGGKCDGWLRAGANDEFAIGYYEQDDLGFTGKAAPAWTVCDNYFAAIMAETHPNRIYQHAAQTDRTQNTLSFVTLPTIWDRLAAAGIHGRYYFSDVPFVGLWGVKYLSISRPFSTFLSDCAAGTLPAVSFVDPKFLDEDNGTSADDHPHGDIRAGQAFLNQVYQAVTKGPTWSRTLLIINYDEWGGFFDHVPPQVAPDANPDWGLRGFRVPCLVISPRARRGHVAHEVYDHTSVLKAIEWRWGLQSLTPRDAAARNIAEVLDFSGAPNLAAPQWDVPSVPVGACNAPVEADFESWKKLRDLAASAGWKF